MKRILIMLTCICIGYNLPAQGFFNQKGDMIKKAIQQIALLNTYIRQAKKGYDIIDKGLKSVRDIKNGEFNLHDLYYTSLKTVNPNIKGYSKVEAAIATALSISKTGSRSMRLAGRSRWLSRQEQQYLRSVFTKLLEETDQELQMLTDLITSGKMQLTDDERLERIDNCYESLKDRSAFCQKFSDSIKMLINSRLSQAGEAKGVGDFYNLKKQ